MAELRSEAPELIPGLHRRAASWFTDHGDEARGLVHAVEAEAWDLAARLARERWIDLLVSAETAAERVPPERHERFAVSVAALRMHLARLDGDLDSAVERGRGRGRPGLARADGGRPPGPARRHDQRLRAIGPAGR